MTKQTKAKHLELHYIELPLIKQHKEMVSGVKPVRFLLKLNTLFSVPPHHLSGPFIVLCPSPPSVWSLFCLSFYVSHLPSSLLWGVLQTFNWFCFLMTMKQQNEMTKIPLFCIFPYRCTNIVSPKLCFLRNNPQRANVCWWGWS